MNGKSGVLGILAVLSILAGCATIPTGRMAISSSAPEEVWIAPKIPESSQRRLEVPVTLELDRGLELIGYRLTIFDSRGQAVRRIETGQETAKKGLFGWKRKALKPPEKLVWDGMDEKGAYVPDGPYTYVVEIWDGLGNAGKGEPKTVHVDNTYPNVELSVSVPYFAPGTEEGPQTLTILQQNPSEAPSWNASIRSATGDPVRSFRWEQLPAEVTWDGTDEQGALMPDGDYSYQVSTVNRAGTPGTIKLPTPLVIDTRPKDVALRLQYRAFSPTGNSPRRTLTISPQLKAAEEVDRWILAIYDASNRTVRNYRGTGAPRPTVFDGRSDAGRYLPDGSYRAVLDVIYASEASTKAISPVFQILTVGPRAQLSLPYLVFAPGAGLKPVLRIKLAAARDARWSGAIFDEAWKPVKRFQWATTPEELVWDGHDEKGARVPDGAYRFVLEGSDAAENLSSFEARGIRVDTRPGTAYLSASESAFSPNGDEVKDSVTFSLGAARPDSISSWDLRISDAQGTERRRFSGTGLLGQDTVAWYGQDDKREELPDGPYTAALALEYENGLTAVSQPVSVLLKTSGPRLGVTLSPPLFSPDGDGENDSLSISIAYHDPTPAASYAFQILDPENQPFFEFHGSGVPAAPLTWDGRSPSGELVQSAVDYPYLLTVRDAAGNISQASGKIPIDVLVIREGDKLRIDVPYVHFEPWSAQLISERQDPVLHAQTQRTFDLLIPKLNRFSDYDVRIEGHAVRIYWWNERLGETEEHQVLASLSRDRAETVRRELIARGVAPERLLVSGLGGTEPIVPFSDLTNRWQDRRVEFILLK
jgi:flagellar hook assembly protein FlgD